MANAAAAAVSVIIPLKHKVLLPFKLPGVEDVFKEIPFQHNPTSREGLFA